MGVVLALHLLLGWVLLTGLVQRRQAELVPQPVETKIIAELKPPPPPVDLPPLRSVAAPPPSFVPPPEVQVLAPPPVITVSVTPAPAPPTVPQVGTETTAPQQGSARPGAQQASTPPQLDFNRCAIPAYPNFNTQGTTLVAFTMDVDGSIGEAHVHESSGPSRNHKTLDRLSLQAVLSCKGTPGTVNGKPVKLRGIVPYGWSLKD